MKIQLLKAPNKEVRRALQVQTKKIHFQVKAQLISPSREIVGESELTRLKCTGSANSKNKRCKVETSTDTPSTMLTEPSSPSPDHIQEWQHNVNSQISFLMQEVQNLRTKLDFYESGSKPPTMFTKSMITSSASPPKTDWPLLPISKVASLTSLDRSSIVQSLFDFSRQSVVCYGSNFPLSSVQICLRDQTDVSKFFILQEALESTTMEDYVRKGCRKYLLPSRDELFGEVLSFPCTKHFFVELWISGEKHSHPQSLEYLIQDESDEFSSEVFKQNNSGGGPSMDDDDDNNDFTDKLLQTMLGCSEKTSEYDQFIEIQDWLQDSSFDQLNSYHASLQHLNVNSMDIDSSDLPLIDGVDPQDLLSVSVDVSNDERSVANDERSVSGDERSVSDDERSVSGDKRSVSNDERFVCNNERSVRNNELSVPNEKQPNKLYTGREHGYSQTPSSLQLSGRPSFLQAQKSTSHKESRCDSPGSLFSGKFSAKPLGAKAEETRRHNHMIKLQQFLRFPQSSSATGGKDSFGSSLTNEGHQDASRPSPLQPKLGGATSLVQPQLCWDRDRDKGAPAGPGGAGGAHQTRSCRWQACGAVNDPLQPQFGQRTPALQKPPIIGTDFCQKQSNGESTASSSGVQRQFERPQKADQRLFETADILVQSGESMTSCQPISPFASFGQSQVTQRVQQPDTSGKQSQMVQPSQNGQQDLKLTQFDRSKAEQPRILFQQGRRGLSDKRFIQQQFDNSSRQQSQPKVLFGCPLDQIKTQPNGRLQQGDTKESDRKLGGEPLIQTQSDRFKEKSPLTPSEPMIQENGSTKDSKGKPGDEQRTQTQFELPLGNQPQFSSTSYGDGGESRKQPGGEQIICQQFGRTLGKQSQLPNIRAFPEGSNKEPRGKPGGEPSSQSQFGPAFGSQAQLESTRSCEERNREEREKPGEQRPTLQNDCPVGPPSQLNKPTNDQNQMTKGENTRKGQGAQAQSQQQKKREDKMQIESPEPTDMPQLISLVQSAAEAGIRVIDQSDLSTLSHLKCIGKSKWGRVDVVQFEGQLLAQKSLAGSEPSSQIHLQNELKTLVELSHPNIVELTAIAVEKNEEKQDVSLLIPFYPLGSLREFLSSNRGNPLPSSVTYDIASGIAQGMSHLHEKCIVHRDLATKNILLRDTVDGGVEAKVADFGFSVGKGSDARVPAGTVCWMAPELFSSEQQQTYSSRPPIDNFSCDVYSFGVILWELITRTHPEDVAMKDLRGNNCSKVRPVVSWNFEEYENREDALVSKIIEVARACVSLCPDDRPTFKQICESFDQVALARKGKSKGSSQAMQADVLVKDLHSLLQLFDILQSAESVTDDPKRFWGLVKEASPRPISAILPLQRISSLVKKLSTRLALRSSDDANDSCGFELSVGGALFDLLFGIEWEGSARKHPAEHLRSSHQLYVALMSYWRWRWMSLLQTQHPVGAPLGFFFPECVDMKQIFGDYVSDGDVPLQFRGTWNGEKVVARAVDKQSIIYDLQTNPLVGSRSFLNVRGEHLAPIVAVGVMKQVPNKLFVISKVSDDPSLAVFLKGLQEEEISTKHKQKICHVIAVKVAQGMKELHSQGVLHRRLCLDNIFVHGDDELVCTLSDYALNWSVSVDAPRVAFVAPELRSSPKGGDCCDVGTDVYSFGMVLRGLFSFGEEGKPFSHSPVSCPFIQSLIAWCTSVSKADRPKSFDEVLKALVQET
eukprot:CAMPEP_0174267906 /NCGR_PEP_ID=MMETSP0439-20130205/35380_1 /TAXON_ID=0 /ORGANISM="Stereomyxa ramosa, Strain Chinc5" /LENGTH=1703 /DNA_ID=CAMNT_0015355707 /DNA_START=505 /DNA_END=5616 /DNA_ORIENTATION=+